jgi:hypothetical protein
MKLFAPDVRILVDGVAFYTFVRSLKLKFKPSELGEVVMSVQEGQLVVASKGGDLSLACGDAPAIRARIRGGNFLALAKLAKHPMSDGRVLVVFRPALDEVGFPCDGARAKFD